MKPFEITPIGIVHSPFKEKFGVPRQPGLVNIESQIEIVSPYNQSDAFRELESFSHIWVTFIFHQAQKEDWSPTVRPPRLGGNKRIGVFASRSPFRPNNLGLSAVALKNLDFSGSGVVLQVEGLDVIDQTPVVDIKPYIPYADAMDATAGYALDAPKPDFEVLFSDRALQQLDQIDSQDLKQQLAALLSFDNRPAYKSQETSGNYGMNFDRFNVRWEIRGNKLEITEIVES
jgi:tRNA-Thr(GGU) m(6)t(6)A37 methyltransferase TsaA